ncbi:hypothetical protein VTH8203_00707 [Vibrio thalassae]|uniref:Chalcone isomerase domain-containing protein n=1 Tax=Vibrio thalassae TaxID=1243014 RepID=A0A240EEY2_9VIBR|nr:chalcone isomerase family protein [Vibrio thalassae]SNX47106.1 hypothetical protein VTH8203_00707 [Vibrio thalassae]
MKHKMVLATLLGLLLHSQSVMASKDAADGLQDWGQWQVVGEAQLSWLFFDVYRSQLLAPQGIYQVSDDVSPHPIALRIQYQRDISRQQLLDATLDQWEKMGVDKSTRNQWIAKLYDIFPSVSDGQQLIYVSDGKTGKFYYLTEQKPLQMIGTVDDKSLNDGFLGIWLSPNSQYPKLRAQLIGMNR